MAKFVPKEEGSYGEAAIYREAYWNIRSEF